MAILLSQPPPPPSQLAGHNQDNHPHLRLCPPAISPHLFPKHIHCQIALGDARLPRQHYTPPSHRHDWARQWLPTSVMMFFFSIFFLGGGSISYCFHYHSRHYQHASIHPSTRCSSSPGYGRVLAYVKTIFLTWRHVHTDNDPPPPPFFSSFFFITWLWWRSTPP